MKLQRRGPTFGERVAFIPMNEKGLKVCRVPSSVDHFNLLWCPGPVVEVGLDAWRTVCEIAKLIGQEGERRGLDVHTQVRQGEVWMAFASREVTFALEQDRTWLIRISTTDVVSVQESGLERVFEVIAQETRGAFQPTREPTLERDTSDLATSAG